MDRKTEVAAGGERGGGWMFCGGADRRQRRQAEKSEVESRRMNDRDEGEKLFGSSIEESFSAMAK